ncbi:hypothetical protein JCM11251_005085 [Rhodosporidiobolus azoricus]
MTLRPPSPQHASDSSARWEAIRREWTTPPNSSSSSRSPSSSPTTPPIDEADPQSKSKRQRDPLFAQRIAVLEQMLRSANAGPSGSKEGWNGASPAAMLSVPVVPPGGAVDVGGIGTAGNGKGSGAGKRDKGKEKAMLEDEGIEPDGGDVIGAEKETDTANSVRELKKVSEGIFLAFKQNRALREPLPLSLVTSLLYRSWSLDGTIPLNYNPSSATLGDPMPMPRGFANGAHHSSAPTSAVPSPGLGPQATAEAVGPTAAMGILPPSTIASLAEGDDAVPPSRPSLGSQRPSLLAALSERNSRAVTPLPSSPSPTSSPAVAPFPSPLPSGPATEAAGPAPPPGPERQASTVSSISLEGGEVSGTGALGDSEDSSLMPPPPVPKKPDPHPLQPPSSDPNGSEPPPAPGLESMGACGESGKLKLDVLRGSRWRTERDVASGSDVI